eukprot:827210_1
MPTGVDLLSTVPTAAKDNALIIQPYTKDIDDAVKYRSVNIRVSYNLIPRSAALKLEKRANRLFVVCNKHECQQRKDDIEILRKRIQRSNQSESMYCIREGYQKFANRHKHWKDVSKNVANDDINQ